MKRQTAPDFSKMDPAILKRIKESGEYFRTLTDNQLMMTLLYLATTPGDLTPGEGADLFALRAVVGIRSGYENRGKQGETKEAS